VAGGRYGGSPSGGLPAVHRLAVELIDWLADTLSDTTAVPPEIAWSQGIALASVFQIIIGEVGRRTREGQIQVEIEPPRRARPLVQPFRTISPAVSGQCQVIRAAVEMIARERRRSRQQQTAVIHLPG
jgi:hypothetical protein